MLRKCWILLGLLLIFGVTAPVLACTPPVGGLPDLTIADYVANAPIVLEGTVLAVSTAPNNPSSQQALIEVSTYFKGQGGAQIRVQGYGDTALCLSPIHQGNHFIFFVAGDAEGYRAVYASQFDAYTLATDETRADVIEAVGQAPTRVEAMPDSAPWLDAPSLVLLALAVGSLVGIGILVYRMSAAAES